MSPSDTCFGSLYNRYFHLPSRSPRNHRIKASFSNVTHQKFKTDKFLEYCSGYRLAALVDEELVILPRQLTCSMSPHTPGRRTRGTAETQSTGANGIMRMSSPRDRAARHKVTEGEAKQVKWYHSRGFVSHAQHISTVLNPSLSSRPQIVNTKQE
jgi:hypothetical protein